MLSSITKKTRKSLTLEVKLDIVHRHERPTELDALVFGHLFTLLTTPLPDNRLATIVRSFSNLVKLCQVVERDFFEKANGGGSSSGNGEGDYDKLEDLNQLPM
ncbi:Metaxin-2 [Portunus trituberculatus]|uniref:Metaxin-2 n=1 Tax=Portunus trituberculatus TaxID=210409 RepID=A0A5B7D7L1_PORTR|nr:Metaxin-2 [Portunus trituberculatus]